MKSNTTPREFTPLLTSLSFVLATSASLFALLAFAPIAHAQITDNFDSGSDAAWQKSATADYPATFSFVPDVFGGMAYRLQAGVPANYASGGFVTLARAVAVRPDQTYSTTFYVAADLVDWDQRVYDPTNEAVVGLVARASSVTTPDQFQGLMLLTHWNQYDSGQRGTAQIYAILQGGINLIPAAQGNFTIARGHGYRMVFAGTNNVYEGSFYDLADLTHPLVTFVCDDSYAAGYFPTNGYSGVVALGYRGASAVNPTTADVTFDNFVAAAFPPTSVAGPATPHGMTAVPQIVNRSPASYANFYVPAGGITFNATTLTATNPINTNAIRLILNGVDVSSSLILTGPATNASVSFPGLASNCVYDARVELQDALGRKTTNLWTFDTFTDAYLASAAARNIECEEYDFGGGQFYDNPIVSGYTTNGTQVSVLSPNTYADQSGVNANPSAGNSPPFDFFDWDTSAHPNHGLGVDAENEFRTYDAVGTQNGSAEYVYAWAGGQLTWRGYDNLRQKYVAAQPDGSLVECGVERTEGGEWLNYTRVFSTNNVYNVYLRHGCALTQTLSLDQIGAGPTTNNLGTFNCVNAFSHINFRYVPLRDSSGKLAVVNLDGTNTLRLTLASPPQDPAVKQGMWMNYLAFVHAVPQVYSSAEVNGTYVPEVNMLVDTGNKRLTVPQSTSARFYRIGWITRVSITGISLTGGNVVLSYYYAFSPFDAPADRGPRSGDSPHLSGVRVNPR